LVFYCSEKIVFNPSNERTMTSNGAAEIDSVANAAAAVSLLGDILPIRDVCNARRFFGWKDESIECVTAAVDHSFCNNTKSLSIDRGRGGDSM
jgi:hypothetical protein